MSTNNPQIKIIPNAETSKRYRLFTAPIKTTANTLKVLGFISIITSIVLTAIEVEKEWDQTNATDGAAEEELKHNGAKIGLFFGGILFLVAGFSVADVAARKEPDATAATSLLTK